MHELEMNQFERALASRLVRYSAIEVSPANSEAIAHQASTHVRSPRARFAAAWRSMRRPLRVVIVIALLAALAASSLYAAGVLLRTPEIDLSSRPLLEATGGLIGGQRYSFQLVRLRDGRVLVVGGYRSNAGTAVGTLEAELFEPSIGRFSRSGSQLLARFDALAVGLSDGRALIAGGLDFNEAQLALTEAEVFDPTTGSFSRIADLPTPRVSCNCRGGGVFARPTVLALTDGRALIAGGVTGNELGNTEIREIELFEPSSGSFRTVDVGCNTARGARVVLADGRVLITCLEGYRARQPSLPAGNFARIFDPRTNEVTETGTPVTSNNGTGTLLPDGRVLLTGSWPQLDAGSEIFDPATGQFALIPGGFVSGSGPAFEIGGGRVFFPGNTDVPATLFDAATSAFTTPAGIGIPIAGDRTMVALADGRLLAVSSDGTALLINPRRIP